MSDPKLSDPVARRESAQRRIWLCADDYGISPSVSAAIRDLIARRRINAASVMVVAPSFARSEAQSLRDAAASRAAIGLHLTLSAPFRPLGGGFTPLRDGAFLPLAATLRHALMRSFDLHILSQEIAGQISAFNDAFGRPPDFIDGHQHVQLFPQISEALLGVIKHAAPKAWVRQCGRPAPARKRLTGAKALLLDVLSRRLRKLAGKNGVHTNPAFAGAYGFGAKADYARLFPRFLDGLPDGGVVMCHPGQVDAELRRLDPLTDLREHEYAFFGDDAFPKLLAAHGVAL